jgi:molecular chaperone DnaK (HSP70)
VPGCFPERQRSALREGFLRAGIRRLRLLDDAIAAVMGSRHALPQTGHLLVVSWGAVALSVSLFRIQGERPGALAQEGDMGSTPDS